MRILVLSNPITNAGDFLFTEKLVEVVKKIIDNNTEVVLKNGMNEITIKEANDYDIIIIGGGPLYDNKMMSSNNLSIMKIIKDIKAKIFIIGAGWYGKSCDTEEVYNYKFDDEVIENLKFVESKGGFLGARDITTISVLKNNGLKNVVLTGCPVWYDFSCIELMNPKIKSLDQVKTIFLSDPGITKDALLHDSMSNQTIELINYVKNKFLNSEVIFTFNNGIYTKFSTPCNVKIMEHCEKMQIRYINMAGSAKEFSNYNYADLHIGYRMHSHIYALSKRIPSILIEEDARGFGFNNSVGLNNITAYDVKNFNNRNKFVINQIDDALNEYESSDFLKIQNAFKVMKYTWDNVMMHLADKILK